MAELFVFPPDNLEDKEKGGIFAGENIDCYKNHLRKENLMLGINDKREPIKGEFVRNIVDSLKRTFKGELTEKERACEDRLNEARSKYDFVWG